MKEKSHFTLIINRSAMRSAGGIEIVFSNIIRIFLNNNDRVIWITNNNEVDKFGFPDLLDNPNFEYYIQSNWNRFISVPHLIFAEDENVIMLTTNPVDYLVCEKMKNIVNVKSFKHFLIIPHFQGKELFIDQWFSLLRKPVYSIYRGCLDRILHNNSLLGFEKKHLETFETYYSLNIPDKEKFILPNFTDLDDINTDNISIKAMNKNNNFIISTCTRLDFPHKGYILGLLDEYTILYKKYPYLQLVIAGFGKDENCLLNKIASLPIEIKNTIFFKGTVSIEQLSDIYEQSHLAIGLAGSICIAASKGTPSLVARHYCNDCEVYGFFNNACDKILCSDKGEDVKYYIEKVINMNANDYIKLSEENYNTYSNMVKVDKDFFYNFDKASRKSIYRGFIDELLLRIIFMIIKMKSFLLKIT